MLQVSVSLKNVFPSLITLHMKGTFLQSLVSTLMAHLDVLEKLRRPNEWVGWDKFL